MPILLGLSESFMLIESNLSPYKASQCITSHGDLGKRIIFGEI